MMKKSVASRRQSILGYTDKLTVRPGERIEFKVSVDKSVPYTAQLVRLINGDVHTNASSFKELEIESSINGRFESREQPVALGSCIVVEDIRPMHRLDELTVAITVMPTTPLHGIQHLIGSWSDSDKRGWSLHVNKEGQLAFTATDDQGMVSSLAIAEPLRAKTWYTTALRVSWRSRTVKLDCRAIGTAPHEIDLMDAKSTSEELGTRPSVSCPLLMAAAFGGRDASGRVIPVGCFNGRLEAPVIYRGVLSDEDLDEVLEGERPAALREHLIADWDFSDGISTTQIKDRSENKLNGHIHNLPLRAVKGRHWNGATLEWPRASEQYAAIHFHSDDLHDCGWLTDISYRIPEDLRSGVYALRLRTEVGSILEEEYLPFFVAAPRGAPQARIAFIVPTYTYLAYGNIRGMLKLAEQHPELGLSLYDQHLDGSPVHFSSWLRPLLNMRPKSILWTLCADLLLTDWLEAKGFDHDVITDDLLQEEGAALLQSYRVVITGNHPEYVTTEQLDAIESYLSEGGRLIYVGGNGYYQRVAVQQALPGVIEVRRGRTGTGTWQSEPGEGGFALCGEIGGIWRDLGRPPQRLVGVGFIGWGFNGCASYYRIVPGARDSRAAFILDGVEGDIIGDFGILGGAAAGQEIDRTNATLGTPAHAVVLARSEGHGSEMLCVMEEMRSLDPIIEHYRSLTCAEVIFFETKNGGAVFSVGSIAWCGSLGHDNYQNNISTITANVVNRFLDVEPLVSTCTR